MKKRVVKTLAAVLICLPLAGTVGAEGAGNYGAAEMVEALPDSVSEFLEENEITPENAGVNALTPENVFAEIWRVICENASKPLTLFATLTGTVLLCSLLEAFRDSAGGGTMTEAFGVVGVLAGATILSVYLSEVLETAGAAVDALSTFLLTYIPAFAGLIAVNGETSTAVVYNGTIIVATQFFSQLTTLVLFPLTSCILGISAAGSVNPDLHIKNIAEGARKVVTWILGIITTIFTGLLSIQSFIASASDSVALKAAKFTVSGAVPIVGGSVADALLTVKGSLNLLKSSAGGFGIVAVLGIILVPLVTVVCFRLALLAAGVVSELFGTEKLTALLKCGESVLGIVIAMLVCFALLIVISTALMLAIGNGGV